MEDFLYILAVLAWVVFSIYKNAQKNKARRPGMTKPPEESSPSREYPDVRSVLREMLGEEEPLVPEPAEMALEEKEEEKFKPIYQPVESLQTWDDLYEQTGQMPSGLMQQEEIPDERRVQQYRERFPQGKARVNFDLKKAVVMAEILRRPYAESGYEDGSWRG